MEDSAVVRLLAGAQLWRRGPPRRLDDADPTASRRVVIVTGWEDGHPFCAALCSTDVGLRFCRRCPEPVVDRVLATGRAASRHCPAGVRLLAFPTPRGSRRSVGVLRVSPPAASRAAMAASVTAHAAEVLLRASRRADREHAAAARRAARILRRPDELLRWQVEQREVAADRRRGATAALAQIVTITEEAHELHVAARRQRLELARHQRRLDRLARQAFQAADMERARVGHEIHDMAAQSMVAAYRFLEAARADAGPAGPRVLDELDEAAARLRAAIGEVRAVLAQLAPPGLEGLGLAVAIERRLADLVAGTGIDGTIDGSFPRLADWLERGLYGMTAEAISNAVRHGDPRSINVTFGVLRGRAVVTVADDGRGFDPLATERRGDGGLGLLGIIRQARWLGGRARIDSAPGVGTRIRISIPLNDGRLLRSDAAP